MQGNIYLMAQDNALAHRLKNNAVFKLNETKLFIGRNDFTNKLTH